MNRNLNKFFKFKLRDLPDRSDRLESVAFVVSRDREVKRANPAISNTFYFYSQTSDLTLKRSKTKFSSANREYRFLPTELISPNQLTFYSCPMQTTFDGPSRSYSIGIGSYPPLIKAYSLQISNYAICFTTQILNLYTLTTSN